MRQFFLAALAASAAALPARSQSLLENGSFEEPQVTGRTPESAGGSPMKAGTPHGWGAFAVSPESAGGQIVAGVTNEIARTGKQSMFVDFQKVTASLRGAVLRTGQFPIKAGASYRVSIWGRIDRKRPLALDERRPRMLLEVAFFGADGTSQAGEPVAGDQPIPGEIVPATTPVLTFRTGKWKESFANVTPPDTAAFMRITWTVATPQGAGETDGIIYWDDASVTEANTPK